MVVGPILLLRDVMQGCIEAYKAWYWGNQKHPGNNQKPIKASFTGICIKAPSSQVCCICSARASLMSLLCTCMAFAQVFL